MWEAADVLIKAALPLTTSDTKTVSEWISQMATLPQASNLATRILLLTLLFEVTDLLPCVIHLLKNYPALSNTLNWREVQNMVLVFHVYQ